MFMAHFQCIYRCIIIKSSSKLASNKGSNIALQQMRIKRRKESVRLIIFSGYNGEICSKDPCFKKLNFIEACNYF